MTPEQQAFLATVTEGWWVPGVVLVAVLLGLGRWILSLSRKINDHAERIAYLEAKANGKPEHHPDA